MMNIDEEQGRQVMMMQVDGSPTLTSQDDDPPYIKMRYKECLKNHAASIGANALDGCGEFLPGDSLNCSACGCHRNFHRKEVEHNPHPPIIMARSSSDINIGDVGVDVGSRAVEDDGQDNCELKKVKKRRFRTKFSREQKEKLARFAERAGWKMQRLEGGVVEEFCREIGIKRKVLKVWMHNNKHKYTTLPHF